MQALSLRPPFMPPAISSSFATFAMAAMVLFLVPSQSGLRGGESEFAAQAESALDIQGSLDLPFGSILRD